MLSNYDGAGKNINLRINLLAKTLGMDDMVESIYKKTV